LSNFDLVLHWLCQEGLKPLLLTHPASQDAQRMESETPRIPVTAFRQAIKHLQQGGMVVTGIDRPIPNPKVRPRFFGQPSALPLHHVFLAMKAGSPLVVAATHLAQDGKYHVHASDVIGMDSYSDPHVGMLRNAEKVLRVAEEFVRQSPQQWVVPLPVWPQSMDLVPR
jgi:KDO2-lipid IV(A) lauroyltransferase